MSKWRTLACSFSPRLLAAEVSLLITWCHLSQNAMPNLSSRPAAPNNTGEIYDSQNSFAEGKNLTMKLPRLINAAIAYIKKRRGKILCGRIYLFYPAKFLARFNSKQHKFR